MGKNTIPCIAFQLVRERGTEAARPASRTISHRRSTNHKVECNQFWWGPATRKTPKFEDRHEEKGDFFTGRWTTKLRFFLEQGRTVFDIKITARANIGVYYPCMISSSTHFWGHVVGRADERVRLTPLVLPVPSPLQRLQRLRRLVATAFSANPIFVGFHRILSSVFSWWKNGEIFWWNSAIRLLQDSKNDRFMKFCFIQGCCNTNRCVGSISNYASIWIRYTVQSR